MHKVIVYTSQFCPWCDRVTGYLNSKKISFTEVDVSEGRENAMEMVQKSGHQEVPVLDIDGKIIMGFDKESIDRALGI